MNFFDRLTKYRYEVYTNINSFKFVDHIITDINRDTLTDEHIKINKKILDKKVFYTDEIFSNISNAIKYTLGILSYQYDNPYIYHRGVPSARNVHPNECYVIYRGHALRYNPKINEFEYITNIDFFTNNIYIILISDLWRIMKFYGEFGLALSILDSGHILSQLKQLLNINGFSKFRIDYMLDKDVFFRKLKLDFRQMMLNYIIDLSEYIDENRENFRVTKNVDVPMRIYSYLEEITFFPNVINFLEKINMSNDKEIYNMFEFKSEKYLSKEELLLSIKTRESNHSYFGIFSTKKVLETEIFYEIINRSADLIFNNVFYSENIRVFCLVNSVFGVKPGYYEVKEDGRIENISYMDDIYTENYKILNDSHQSINLSSNPVVFFVSYDITGDFSEEEKIYFSHLLSAESIHYISTIVSLFGLYSRPIKNFKDDYLEKVLRLDKDNRIMYALMIGRGNTYNYKIYFS
ncbi:hypothetical protein [Caloranaerobacter sp. DY30410]|uniref:hypothetical protein n=1 Tax=Caloranaerobacter sp. DY30410 TaxID=3238305 RepID=UPI003D074B05